MKLSSIVLSAILFASVQHSNASSNVPLVSLSSEDMAITAGMDDRCINLFAGHENLRKAVIDFAVNENAIEERAAWPILCTLAHYTKTVTVTKEGEDLTFHYISNRGKQIDYVLQRVEHEMGYEAYQIVYFDGQDAMEYRTQLALLDTIINMNQQAITKSQTTSATAGK